MTSSTQSPSPVLAAVTIAGRGRLGQVLARSLEAAGMKVTVVPGRTGVIEPAQVVVLCVPDDAIAGVAASVRGSAEFIGHMSGATPLASSGVDFGMHPLQTFVGAEGPEAFHGTGCAIAGTSTRALEIARELANRLGSRPFVLADDDRAGYHAAASIASNFVVTLLSAAEDLTAAVGLSENDSRALLAPLVRSTVENWAADGPIAALTGPIARGDVTTVERQREAVADHAPAHLALFDALRASTELLAEKKRAAA